MGRRDNDEESVVTVNFDDDVPRSKSGKPLSDKKLRQLALARDKALLKRRQKLKSKLEAKLSELRQILGPDNRPDIERVAHMLLKQEETLRSKQNALVLEVKDVITDFKADLQAIKERLSSQVTLSCLYRSRDLDRSRKPRPLAPVGQSQLPPKFDRR